VMMIRVIEPLPGEAAVIALVPAHEAVGRAVVG